MTLRRNHLRVGTAVRHALLGLGGVLGMGAFALLPLLSARAESSYEAFAQANAFESTIANPSIPTGIAIEGGGPQAQARQNSIGVRDASAQFPYAGNTVPGLPATGASLFGLPAPAYPFAASSNAGSDPTTVSYPGLTLHTESRDFSTEASGLAGDDGSFGVRSTARVDESRSGDVTSMASTVADSIKLGSYASLSDVRSIATVVADGATGKLRRTTSTSIGRISVPSLELTIPQTTPAQAGIPIPIPGVPNQAPAQFPPFPIPMGGQTLHNPDIGIQNGFFTVTQVVGGQKQTWTIPSDAALAAFKQAGYTITFQAPEETKGGILSGTYRFSYVAAAPPPNTYYNGQTRFTQTTALVAAAVDLQPTLAAAPGGAAAVTPSAVTPSAVTPGAGTPSAGTPSAGTGFVSAPIADAFTPVAVPAVETPAGAPARSTLDTVSLSAQSGSVGASGVKVGSGADGMYLAVVLVAGLGFLAATGVSVLGVRSKWSS